MIRDWPAPANRKQLRSFLGLANYYRKFVQRFAELANPLTQLTSPQQPYVWTELHERAFDSLKRELTSTSFPQLPNYDLPFVIHTDASDVAVGAVLAQDPGEGLRPLAYYSKNLLPAQRTYATYDQELLAIVQALKTWRTIVYGVSTTVFTDHRPLVNFLDKKDLNGRQARWWLELAEFQPHLTIKYQLGKANVVADAKSETGSRSLDHCAPTNGFIPQCGMSIELVVP